MRVAQCAPANCQSVITPRTWPENRMIFASIKEAENLKKCLKMIEREIFGIVVINIEKTKANKDSVVIILTQITEMKSRDP